jgi:heme exporter protein C
MATEIHPSDSSVSAARTGKAVMPAPFQWLIFAWICGVIYAAFFVVPPVPGLGPTTKVVYFHVPLFWTGAVALIVTGIYSGIYLKTRRVEWDTKAVAAAELGLFYCVLGTMMGSLWARVQWGAWWNWDPKQTSILMLILLYGAYFALRSSIESRPRRAALGAVYALLAVVAVPLLMRVIPYYLKGLHPNPVFEGTIDPEIRRLLLASWAGFLGLFVWMFRQRVEVGRFEDKMEGAE